jgi:hypothetical protein
MPGVFARRMDARGLMMSDANQANGASKGLPGRLARRRGVSLRPCAGV